MGNSYPPEITQALQEFFKENEFPEGFPKHVFANTDFSVKVAVSFMLWVLKHPLAFFFFSQFMRELSLVRKESGNYETKEDPNRN